MAEEVTKDGLPIGPMTSLACYILNGESDVLDKVALLEADRDCVEFGRKFHEVLWSRCDVCGRAVKFRCPRNGENFLAPWFEHKIFCSPLQ